MPELVIAFTFAGCLVGAGLFVAGAALVPAPVRLQDALRGLDGGGSPEARASGVRLMDPGDRMLDRVGLWMYRRLRLPLSDATAQLLALHGRAISDFFAEKLVWMTLGATMPAIYAVGATLMGSSPGALPFGLSLAGAAIGYFAPDMLLRRSAVKAKQGAEEALFTFFDLVVLERLANRSSTQALHSAASVSDAAVFLRIRTALDRARLEQVPPWQELRRLSSELDLPVIGDMADVLRLDEQGAALAGPLRARVRELRDAHLTQMKQDAQSQTEGMTIWATLPVLVFAAILVAPPLLLLVQQS